MCTQKSCELPQSHSGGCHLFSLSWSISSGGRQCGEGVSRGCAWPLEPHRRVQVLALCLNRAHFLPCLGVAFLSGQEVVISPHSWLSWELAAMASCTRSLSRRMLALRDDLGPSVAWPWVIPLVSQVQSCVVSTRLESTAGSLHLWRGGPLHPWDSLFWFPLSSSQ